MIASFILANAYSSIFYSSFTVLEYRPPIDTFSDLMRVATDDTYRITVQAKSAIGARILDSNANDTAYQTLKKHMQRHGHSRVDSYTEMMRSLEADPRVIMLSMRNSAQFRRQLYATKQMHISSETIGMLGVAWPLPWRSPMKAPINRM